MIHVNLKCSQWNNLLFNICITNLTKTFIHDDVHYSLGALAKVNYPVEAKNSLDYMLVLDPNGQVLKAKKLHLMLHENCADQSCLFDAF